MRGLELTILQNDFKRQWALVGPLVLDAVQRVGSSGRYILGHEVEAFETELAGFCGMSHAVGTGNGLDALEIGLRCLGLKAGDKVLTTPLSAFATTLAILRAGGVPVFVDVDDTGGVDLAQCRAFLEREPSIRFLLPVHLYGRSLNLEELQRLQRDFQLKIVEDCAQALGAVSGGIPVGTAGQIAATSFYPTKNLGALGDAGALLTNDPALAAAAKEIRNYGQSSQYVHSRLGLNSRLDEMHAAILRDAFLPHLPEWTTARQRTATKYLAEIRNAALTLPPSAPASDSVWHIFPVLVTAGSRDDFQKHCAVRGIMTAVHYPTIIPDQPALADGGWRDSTIPLQNARRFAQSEVSLPVHPFMSDAEIDSVVRACNDWSAS